MLYDNRNGVFEFQFDAISAPFSSLSCPLFSFAHKLGDFEHVDISFDNISLKPFTQNLQQKTS